MNILKFFEKLFPKPDMSTNLIKVYYQCQRCKNVFELILRKSYDIQSTYGETPDYAFLYQKELRDPKCFNTIRVKIFFDQHYNILKHEIQGGKLITPEQYAELRENVSQ